MVVRNSARPVTPSEDSIALESSADRKAQVKMGPESERT